MRLVRAIVSGVVILSIGSGCTTLQDILGRGDRPFEVSELTGENLAANIRGADSLYREPRDVQRVAKSLESCLAAISPENDHAALWRAVRAAAWLSQHSPTREERLAFGEQGIRLGSAAIDLETLEDRPEPYYYLALAMANFCEVKGTCEPGFIAEVRDRALDAQRIDAGFDHCGPSRFVGELIVQASEYPGFSVGDFEEGLGHLERAAKDCPDFAENWLLLGLALLDDGDDESAKTALEKVLALPAPADHSAEHAEWVERAREALEEL